MEKVANEFVAPEGCVNICSTLYIKEEANYETFLQALRDQGYEIGDFEGRPNAKLGETVLKRVAKCGTCNKYIDLGGVLSHHHRCEACNAYTCSEYNDGGTMRFYFINRSNTSCDSYDLTLRIKGYDEERKVMVFYPQLVFRPSFSDEYRKLLGEHMKRNKHLFKTVKQDGKKYLEIPYSGGMRIEDTDVINCAELVGRENYAKVVQLYKGKEYPEYSRIPMPDFFCIDRAWLWAPIKSNPKLHEQIIHAAGMVSRCDYWYQDGRQAFYPEHFNRMRLFVENFTEISLEDWDRAMKIAPNDGPGFIHYLARFCSGQDAVIEDHPNIFNLIGLFSGGSILEKTEGEIKAAAKAASMKM